MIRLHSLLAVMLLLMISFFGCTFQEEAAMESGIEESFPDIRLLNGRYQVSQSSNELMSVNADLIEITENENLAYFVEADFEQTGSDGSMLFSGHAGELTIDTDSDTIHIARGYNVSVHEGEFLIQGEELLYESKKRLLSTDSDQRTSLTNEKGDILSGIGFTGDLNKKLFEFNVLEEGHISR